MRRPRIQTPLPGPKAAALINRDEAVTSPSLPREYPLVLDRALGCWIIDPDGNEFLDFTSGIAVCNTGHCHPKVVAAAQEQLTRLIHTCGADFYHSPMVRVAEKLGEISPGTGPKRVFLANGGAEAVEAGLKLARHHTGRHGIIAFLGAFHGRTMGAISLTASKSIQKGGFGPMVPGVSHLPYGHCYRCTFNLTYPACNLACVDYIEEAVFESRLPPEEVAVIVAEPIQGEGGYIVPPPDYHRAFKALAEKYGILYMVDEIQSGMGRTGKMFAIEHFGVEPDIMTVAKGIASGMPLSAMVAREEVMDWPRGAHGSTFGGNPVSCAAALATLEIIQDGLVENAVERGRQMKMWLTCLQGEYEVMGDVRGLGLMQAVEFVKDRETKERAPELRDRIIEGCFEKGLCLLSCGRSTLRFCPPLIISHEELEAGMEIFAQVLAEKAG